MNDVKRHIVPTHTKRLRLFTAICIIAILLPVVLLVVHSVRTLYKESLLDRKSESLAFQALINREISELIKQESNRPIEHYWFFNVLGNSLNNSKNVSYSPLAETTPKTNIPGLFGYFQIDHAGNFETPILPSTDPYTLKFQSKAFNINEIKSRMILRDQILEILRPLFPWLGESESVQLVKNKSGSITQAKFEREPTKVGEFMSKYSQSQVIFIEGGWGVFLRKSKVGEEFVLQGFIFRPAVFFRDLVTKAISIEDKLPKEINLTIRRNEDYLLVLKSGSILEDVPDLSAWPESLNKQTLIYSSILNQPFQEISLIWSVDKLKKNPQENSIYSLLSLLVFSIILGIFALYWTSSTQVNLAEERSNFISSVSHELKTPLTSIKMYAELLQSDWVSTDEKRKEYYQFIYSESERLNQLIQRVLDFSKQSSTASQMKEDIFAPYSILEELFDNLKASSDLHGFDLHIIKPEIEEKEEVTINVNKEALIQILTNYIDNAIKYSKNSSIKRIEIGYRIEMNKSQNNELIFFVRDYGPGIETKEMSTLFDAFVRGNDEKISGIPGLGLGLALVKRLAELMGAKVEAENMQPGSEFRVIFY